MPEQSVGPSSPSAQAPLVTVRVHGVSNRRLQDLAQVAWSAAHSLPGAWVQLSSGRRHLYVSWTPSGWWLWTKAAGGTRAQRSHLDWAASLAETVTGCDDTPVVHDWYDQWEWATPQRVGALL